MDVLVGRLLSSEARILRMCTSIVREEPTPACPQTSLASSSRLLSSLGGGEGGEELELFQAQLERSPPAEVLGVQLQVPASIILPRPPVSLRFRFAFMRAISSFMPKGFVT